jgi:hypothetical protein
MVRGLITSLRNENLRLQRELYDTQVRCTASELGLSQSDIGPDLVVSNFDLSEDDIRYLAVRLINEGAEDCG